MACQQKVFLKESEETSQRWCQSLFKKYVVTQYGSNQLHRVNLGQTQRKRGQKQKWKYMSDGEMQCRLWWEPRCDLSVVSGLLLCCPHLMGADEKFYRRGPCMALGSWRWLVLLIFPATPCLLYQCLGIGERSRRLMLLGADWSAQGWKTCSVSSWQPPVGRWTLAQIWSPKIWRVISAWCGVSRHKAWRISEPMDLGIWEPGLLSPQWAELLWMEGASGPWLCFPSLVSGL